MFVGAFIGPTLRSGALGFFWMKDFGCVLVVPSRLFAESESFESPSNKCDCFVASSLTSIVAVRSASNWAGPSYSFFDFCSAVDVLTGFPAVFLLFTLRPSPSSDSEPEDDSDEDGGATTFRILAFAARFLKIGTAESAIAED